MTTSLRHVEESIITSQVRLSMWDTAGQETYDRLRTQSYADADVVVIVFAIDSPESLPSVETRWNPEVRHFCYGVPFLLVGNKKVSTVPILQRIVFTRM